VKLSRHTSFHAGISVVSEMITATIVHKCCQMAAGEDEVHAQVLEHHSRLRKEARIGLSGGVVVELKQSKTGSGSGSNSRRCVLETMQRSRVLCSYGHGSYG
jgi:hypothetical protein